MANPKKYNTRELTNRLRELAAEAHTIADDGELISKGEALAKLLFDKALGHVETRVDEEGEKHEVIHKPESWAIQLIYDRLEGKTPQAAEHDDETKVKALDQVRELAKARLNDAAEAATTGAIKGPPKHKPKK